MTKREDIVAGALQVIARFTFRVTLRQIFYRLVEDLRILAKTENEYKRLSKVLVDARLAGEVPMDALADLGRALAYDVPAWIEAGDHFDLWLDAFKGCDLRYHVPRWHGQDEYVELWVEKAALQSFMQQITEPLEVPLFPTRGYPSLTSLKEAADRIDSRPESTDPVILYFGDHDPSGQDITRYIRERLQDDFGIEVEVERVAINPEQIGQYDLPTAPPKPSDSRTRAFEIEHGSETVELEAFDPNELAEIVRNAIDGRFDGDEHARSRQSEAEGREAIQERVREALREE